MIDFVPGQVTEMTGLKFSRLLVLSFAEIRSHKAWWSCLCDCGTQLNVQGKKLRNGHTKSCGCWKAEVDRCRFLTHGKTYREDGLMTREYQAWTNMKQRVLNPKNNEFRNYGGRGITICPAWLKSFETFYADMGPCPENLELDRIDVNGNYDSSNCRWSDEKIQRRNQRKFIERHGLEAVYEQ